MVRGRTEKVKVERNRLMWMACLPPRVRVTTGPRLLLRAMSVSVLLPQRGYVLISMARVATKDHTDDWGLDQQPVCWQSVTCQSEWSTLLHGAVVTSCLDCW